MLPFINILDVIDIRMINFKVNIIIDNIINKLTLYCIFIDSLILFVITFHKYKIKFKLI